MNMKRLWTDHNSEKEPEEDSIERILKAVNMNLEQDLAVQADEPEDDEQETEPGTIQGAEEDGPGVAEGGQRS